MIRKSIFALAAVATLAATALVPSEAAAKSWKGGGGYGWGRIAVGSAIVLGATALYASCYRWVQLRDGTMVRQYVCD
jgi:hypothetical protein